MANSATANPDSDRNLLFGVLALQADLIDANRFAEACTAWSARKDTPLASLLVERGWLTAEDRQGVEQFLERKLKKHGGDVHASLAEVMSDPVRQTLTNVADPVIHQTLSLVLPADGLHEKTTVSYQPAGRDRYTLTRLHAQGGIGQVWVARDGDLGREVALKELLGARANNPAVVARFVEEAKITGQLQHPNIVPVYELVRPADPGKGPFYTMRFVRGRTLRAAVQQYHEKRRANEAGPLELRELLNHFVAMCNAVAYAHSRGVLHRDLKPGNVVLGDFGEVILLDWGLAKLKSAPEGPTSLLPVSVAAESSRDATVQGQAIGTPSYMPPEQAEGRLDRVDERSDVYGLGAVLYEILTGRPPFDGPDTAAILAQVLADVPPPPRRLVPQTPRALEAVALRALAKQPEGRYASARELAADVVRWLGDEPVTAYREPWAVRAGRWRRRHSALVASAAAAVVATVTLAGTGLFLWQRERDRQWQQADDALRQAEELRGAERWSEERAALQRAEDRLGGNGPPAARERLRQLSGELDLVARLKTIRESRLEQGSRDRKEKAARAYQAAFREAGLGGPEDDPAEVGRRVAASGIRDQLVAALDDWAAATTDGRRGWSLRAALAADPGPARDRLREPAAWADERALAKVAAEVPPDALPTGLAVAVGYQIRKTADGEKFLRAAQLLRPGDFWANAMLAHALLESGKTNEAEMYCRAALAARPDSVVARINLAVMLFAQDKGEDDAAHYLREALELVPTDETAYINLGEVEIRRGRPEGEVALARKALKLPSQEIVAEPSLEQGLLALGRYAEAREAGSRALAKCPPDVWDRRYIEEFTRQAEAGEQLSAALAQDGVPPGGVAFAEACFARKYFTAAARAYAGALADDPGLADDPRAGYALKAARAAALASSGQGKEPWLDTDASRHFRGQARRWLQEEVTRLQRQAGGGAAEKAAAARGLQRLMADDDLDAVRDAGALARLPGEERKIWDKLWSRVQALLDEMGFTERPVELRAADARRHGPSLYLTPAGNLINWHSPNDYPEWLVKGARPGKYSLSLTYALQAGFGGNYVVAVGKQTLRGQSRETGGWQVYKTVKLGPVTLPAGDTTVTVRPEGPFQRALMDLRSLTLTPVPEP
jgi:Tfp pilus assembly protein PilF